MGIALVPALALNGHEVTVGDFLPAVVEETQARRENRRFLPGIALPTGIYATNSLLEGLLRALRSAAPPLPA